MSGIWNISCTEILLSDICKYPQCLEVSGRWISIVFSHMHAHTFNWLYTVLSVSYWHFKQMCFRLKIISHISYYRTFNLLEGIKSGIPQTSTYILLHFHSSVHTYEYHLPTCAVVQWYPYNTDKHGHTNHHNTPPTYQNHQCAFCITPLPHLNHKTNKINIMSHYIPSWVFKNKVHHSKRNWKKVG